MSEQLSFEDAAAPEPPAPRTPDGPPPTPEQAAAIDARDRHVFLEAGAGTGKTRVLVERYCDAVDIDEVDPERILAFTFTERAAAEMRRRVRVELARRGEAATEHSRRERLLAAARAGEGAPITTIHGFCRRLLASHPVAAGIDPRFRVLDADEASRLGGEAYDAALAELAGGESPDEGVIRVAAGYRYRLPGMIRYAHSDLRNRGAGRPELPPLQISALERGGKVQEASPAEVERAAGAYDALRALLGSYADHYEELCAGRSGVDFDHLQLLALGLLRERRSIAEAQRERFDHLLVDEFQDTSPIQVELVKALVGPGTRLFAVGDEFQSIYAFRGADLSCFRRERELMAERAESAPGEAVVLPLSGSFRSDPDVVAAVNALGAAVLDDFAPLRVGRLRPEPPSGPDGPTVELVLTRSEGWGDAEAGTRIQTARQDASQSRVAEARFLAERLRELADGGVDPGGMVVLLRAFTNVDVYAEALELAGLDPHVIGGRGYWSAQQVADALGLLACVANPLDDGPLLGALASPACAASPDAIWMLRRIAGGGRHLWPALEDLFAPREEAEEAQEGEEDLDEREVERRRQAALWTPRIPPADRERLERFHGRLTALRERAPLLPLDTLVEATLEAFGYDLTTLLAGDGRKRTANLRKLVRIATEFEAHDGRDLRGFLDHAAARAAFSDREAEAAMLSEQHAGVRVMTIHAAKGLEFETVAVADLGRKLCTGGQPPELRLDFDVEATAAIAGEGPPPARVGLRLARAGGASIDTEGYKALNDDAADAEAEESGRLAYVAASRAERRLILSGVFSEKDLESADKPRRQRSALGCLLPALGLNGEDGESAVVAAPEPRDGLEEKFAPATIPVRVIGACAESVERLSRARPREAAPALAAEGGKPPLTSLSEGGAAAARGLSYAALSDFGRCGYRFLVERVIGLGGESGAAVPATARGDEFDVLPQPARGSRMGFGRAVHELLEWSARNGWEAPPAELLERALERESVVGDGATAARAAIEGWLGSELLANLKTEGVRLRPEVPFRTELGAGTVLRGTIDLLGTAADGAPWVVDYKTNRLRGGPVPPDLEAAYALQRDLYAVAVADATGADEVRSAYVFLERPGEPILATLDSAAIEAGRERIERVVGDIRAGHFEPTPHPHRDLCHDCPARERLCPYDKEATGRADPAPAVTP